MITGDANILRTTYDYMSGGIVICVRDGSNITEQ